MYVGPYIYTYVPRGVRATHVTASSVRHGTGYTVQGAREMLPAAEPGFSSYE
jgi:hypothetical protein